MMKIEAKNEETTSDQKRKEVYDNLNNSLEDLKKKLNNILPNKNNVGEDSKNISEANISEANSAVTKLPVV